jgi:nicotinamide-nucleotide amidase
MKMSSTLEGAECLPNPVGWAPVTILKISDCTITLLPGPPKEVQACFNEYLARRIENATGLRSCAKRVRVSMMSESQLAPAVSEITKTFEGVYLKPLVAESTRENGIPVEVLAFDKNDESSNRKCQEAVVKLKELIIQSGGMFLE